MPKLSGLLSWRPSRFSLARLGDLAAPALAITAMGSLASAQQWTSEPPVAADLKAAMSKADAGDPAALLALADSGRADAQMYAGTMLIFGRGGAKPDGKRGCAYEIKASATRADAMHLVGLCYQRGAAGPPEPEKAKAAYARAAEMGFPKSKCALGQMLMVEPGQGQKGVDLCRQAGQAGDLDAQMTVAGVYIRGGPVKADHKEARKWFDMAARQGSAEAARRLGELYAAGDGGKRDTKKALELWMTAEKAGDALAPILVADQLFSDMTGGKKPGPGKYGFRGGIPVGDIEVIEDWYKQAQQRDPRPEVKKRAEYALSILASFKTAANAATTTKR